MTLNVDYTFPDLSTVRKAIPEEWRGPGESDSDLVSRAIQIFGLGDRVQFSLNLAPVPPDPVPGPTLDQRVKAIETFLGLQPPIPNGK